MKSHESENLAVDLSKEGLDKNATILIKEGYDVLSKVPEVKHILDIITKKPKKGASQSEKIDIFLASVTYPRYCYFQLGDYFYYINGLGVDPDELVMIRNNTLKDGDHSSFEIIANEVRGEWGFSRIDYTRFAHTGSDREHHSNNQMAIDRIRDFFGQIKKDLRLPPNPKH